MCNRLVRKYLSVHDGTEQIIFFLSSFSLLGFSPDVLDWALHRIVSHKDFSLLILLLYLWLTCPICTLLLYATRRRPRPRDAERRALSARSECGRLRCRYLIGEHARTASAAKQCATAAEQSAGCGASRIRNEIGRSRCGRRGVAPARARFVRIPRECRCHVSYEQDDVSAARCALAAFSFLARICTRF